MKEFIVGFEECFDSVDDKRQESKVSYPLIEILFLTVVSVSAGAETWEMIEAFGGLNLEIFRAYYQFKNGMPSDDTVRRLFEVLDPKQLNEALKTYFTNGIDIANEQIVMDGKTLKGSKANGMRALHFLNVYASNSGLTLFGQEVDAKTNEITAIKEAIELLDLKGSIVTIDAMGCQKDIAQKLIAKEADYIFGLKGNHAKLRDEVKTAFETDAETFFNMEKAETVDKGHGREETRACRVIRDFSKIPSSKDWVGIASVIEIKRLTTTKDKTTEAINYYISSSSESADKLMQGIRDHWKIESMHWTLDVVFKEDASKMNKGNIPANMAIIRRFVLNLLSGMKEKRSSRPKLIKMIGWSPDYLHKFIQKLMICS